MWTGRSVRVAGYSAVMAAAVSAQSAVKVDFARDVAPIFRQNCIGCHGPSQQINGLRLDRRSSVFKSTLRRVVPGSAANSLLLHRLNDAEYGLQMPPTGPLRPEQVDTIRKWIDQGAEWPDSLANEADLPPLNAKAVAMVDCLRRDDRQAFLQYVAADPALLNARGPDGATPFMYAVLYTPAAFLSELLAKGADPNRAGDTHATALMWAVTDMEKTRLLVDHRADVNARSDELRTPLMIAAGRPGGAPVVKLLLDHGAKPDPNRHPASESSALIEAATAGDAEIMQLLIARGADVKAAAQPALAMAIANRCPKCFELLAAGQPDKAAYTGALGEAAIFADATFVRRLLDLGADVNAVDGAGRTPLMYAAGSDLVPLDVVKLLVERGANVNVKVGHPNSVDTGWTVLDIARLRGQTPVVDFLVKAGAKESAATGPLLLEKKDNTLVEAIQASLPLLQRADANFVPKAACASCHNNSLGAMTVGLARKNGFHVDEASAAQQVQTNIAKIESYRDRLRQGFLVPIEDNFGPAVLGYILAGLDAEHYKADLNTDAAAMYLKMHQKVNGQWDYPDADTRPPLCSEYIGQTALAMRGLQLYAPATDKAAYRKAIALAAGWLAGAKSRVTNDRSWRLLGLAWAGTNALATQAALKELVSVQRGDGGWSEIPSMNSNAFSTGKSMVALRTAGMPVSDPVYQRGLRFLLGTQQEDGSWYVKTRALAFQPYFDAGFPHGFDQYISTAGSNWATMALTLATPPAAAPVSGQR